MADTTVDVESIEHLDFHPSCEQRNCDHDAKVIGTLHMPCCGANRTRLLCPCCLDRVLTDLARPVPRLCRICSAAGFPMNTRMLSWQPIGGAR